MHNCLQHRFASALVLGCLVSLPVALTGCVNNQPVQVVAGETLQPAPKREVYPIAKREYAKYLTNHTLSTNQAAKSKLQSIFDRLLDMNDIRAAYDWQMSVIADDDAHIRALPQGFIIVNDGAVQKAQHDDELALLIATAIARITNQNGNLYNDAADEDEFYRSRLIQVSGIRESTSDPVLSEIYNELELDADRDAIRMVKTAGYNTFLATSHINAVADQRPHFKIWWQRKLDNYQKAID